MPASHRPPRGALAGVAAAALLAACAGAKPPPGPPGRIPDPVAPPRAAFQAYPEAQVSGVKNPHAYQGKALCQRCHAPDLTILGGDPITLCHGCHRFPHKSHPVQVVQKSPSGDLPLLAGGQLACHTCHDPHRAKAALRKPFSELCKDCHKGH